ncbi:MAG TPA: hypothetical protein VFC26_00385, partial [Verrucomicrobiae bacterium]|nr:hypothetical protein [Verrucomicrobiae bacterium]
RGLACAMWRRFTRNSRNVGRGCGMCLRIIRGLEMQVEDPDGNVLRIGSEPKPGEPYGQFLDAKSVLWDTRSSQPCQ